MKIDKGTLLIRNGFTHFPQEQETLRFFKGDLTLPEMIVMLDGSGGLSFDVITWLAEQRTNLACINYQGDVVSVIGGVGTTVDPDHIRWQIETRSDPVRRLDFCCDLIADKVRSSILTLQSSFMDHVARAKATKVAESVIDRLERRAVRDVRDIMLLEARAAKAYFGTWRHIPIRWKRVKRDPVPEAWLTLGSRQTIADRAPSNRHATHPVNAMLNYAYGLLYSRTQITALAEGYDPRLGIMHETRMDAQAYALDIMEPDRPRTDAMVLRFVASNMFTRADFTITSQGICRLAPQLARRLTEQVAIV